MLTRTPRSIVTDHYLLDSISASMHAIDCVKRVLLIIVSVSTHQRPNLASGISLYVSDDRKVAMGVPPARAGSSDQGARMVI